MKVVHLLITVVLDVAEGGLQDSRRARETDLPTIWCHLDLLACVTKGQNSSDEVGDHKMSRLSCTFKSCILRSEFLDTLTFRFILHWKGTGFLSRNCHVLCIHQ